MGPHDIRIVLVEPSHPGNVGAAARAMKTMGLSELVLVRPAEFPALEADQRAVSAVDVLERAQVVEHLSDATRDCSLVIGTTGRTRQHAHPVLDPHEAARKTVDEAETGASVAILFGSERDGLSNDALDACAFQLRIPTGDALPSLNLAAAVQLVCYEILMASTPPSAHTVGPASTEAAYPPHDDLEFFYSKLREALDAHDFFDAQNPEPTYTRIRRIFGRARPDSSELLLLHGLVRLMGKRS